MRLAAMVVVVALAAAVFVVPSPVLPETAAAPAPVPAPFVVCPGAEAARRGTAIDILGEGREVEATVFSSGEVVAERTISISDGTGELGVGNLTGLARAPVLLGLETADVAVEATVVGAGSATGRCDAGADDTVVVPGGSTSEGETFELHVANPFAGSAAVAVTAASEVGTESAEAMETVVVPPRSLVTLDLSGILPGRQIMSVAATPLEGRVVVAATQEGGGDVAAMQAIVPSSDWYMPFPPVDATNSTLVVMAPGTAEVPVQLDLYGPEGVVEGGFEGTVPSRGQLSVPVTDLGGAIHGVRIVAAGPVAASLRLAGEAGRVLIPAVAAPAPSWLVPGAGRYGAASVYIFNPGVVDVTAQMTTGGGTAAEPMPVAAGSVVVAAVPLGGGGARVDADGEVVAVWTSLTQSGGVTGDAAVGAG